MTGTGLAASPSYNRSLNVLFVCFGNACRSQMAEAFANRLGEGRIRAWSAGSHPLGYIIEDTRAVLREKGVLIDGQFSKGLKDVPMEQMDVIVTMGCEVNCPLPAGFKGRVTEWNVPDPFAHGLDFFRNVRDLIARQVRELVEELQPASRASGLRKFTR